MEIDGTCLDMSEIPNSDKKQILMADFNSIDEQPPKDESNDKPDLTTVMLYQAQEMLSDPDASKPATDFSVSCQSDGSVKKH